jgi:Cu+-exporting ATPase
MKIPFFSKKKEMAEDPVCHMQVDTANPGGGTAVHEGATYYFCGPGCRVAFEKDPAAYLSGEKSIKM